MGIDAMGVDKKGTDAKNAKKHTSGVSKWELVAGQLSLVLL